MFIDTQGWRSVGTTRIPQALPIRAEGIADPPPGARSSNRQESVDDAGWAHLGTFGSYLTKLQPEFDSRLYGYKKLSDLVKARTELFATEERQVPGSPI